MKQNEKKALVSLFGGFDFKTHLVIYLVIMGMLFIINVLTSPGYYWVVWPAFLWGGIIVLHGLLTYVVK